MASDLDRLKKASLNTQATNNTESEHYSRNRTVRSEEIKSGLSRFEGSWASDFSFGVSNKKDTHPLPSIKTGLGLQGYGDIDFIPYVENTNRIGLEGEATLGSPISFEVIGPTLKSPLVDWTWQIARYSDGEYLILWDAGSGTIPSLYGINDNSNLAYPYSNISDDEGLYVILRSFGRDLDYLDGDRERTPYHIFKVAENGVLDYSVKISSDTPISDVLDYSTDNTIAGVTFVRKVASRMFCVPSSNRQTFFVMPPEKSLSLDIEPPFEAWLDGSFDGLGKSGSVETYGNRSNLPVLSPLQYEGVEIFNGIILNVSTPAVSTFKIYVDDEFSKGSNILDGKTGLETQQLLGTLFKVGYVIRVVSIEEEASNRYLGYFEITDIQLSGGSASGRSPLELTLKGVTTQNHISGNISWDIASADSQYDIKFTVHESVSDLLSKSNPQPHEIDSTRIKSLISPLHSDRSSNVRPTMMRANDCTWGEGEISNLLDLGFKAVIYNPKLQGSNLVADFNSPVDSNLYEIDYEGATIYFHEEVVQEDKYLNHAQNPTGSPVLFISCVPLSQNASFGNRFTAKEEGIVKGAFKTPTIKNILSGDTATFGKTLSEIPDFPSSVYLPGISLGEIPSTGAIEFRKDLSQFGTENVEYVTATYNLVTSHLEGVVLKISSTTQIGDSMGTYGLSNPLHIEFVRNPSVSFRESIYAGLSLRTEEVTFAHGLISLDERGNQTLEVSGLSTEESSILYDSSENKWEISGDYNVNLSVTRGDLVASNVVEFDNSDLTIAPYSQSLKISSSTSFNEPGCSFTFTTEDGFGNHEDLRGYYLNTEAVTIITKETLSIPPNNRIVFGLDYIPDCHNPFASEWYKSELHVEVVGSEEVGDFLKSALPSEKQPAISYDASDVNDGHVSITGRNACIYPAYALVETAQIYEISAEIHAQLGGTYTLPASRYLLSLESTEPGLEDRWVSLVVNNEAISFDTDDYVDVVSMLEYIAEKLNKDLYFGHSARLLDRAGFYDSQGQDWDGTNYTSNGGLDASIKGTAGDQYGERQILWVSPSDVRHPKFSEFSLTNYASHTLALICTGRGASKSLNGTLDEMKEQSILQENRLINVIASIGEIDQSFMWYIFKDGLTKFNRIGYYHREETLADNTTATGNPTVMGQTGNLALGFPSEGILPLGRLLGESFRIKAQNTTYDGRCDFEVGFVDDPTGRPAYYPIRSNLTLSYDSTYLTSGLPDKASESSDFAIQNSWLDNQSFAFEGSSYETPDFRNYAWVSRDYFSKLIYDGATPYNQDPSVGGYVEIHATFSATPKERSYFYGSYLGDNDNNLGHEDYVAKIDSSKFITPLIDRSVLQKGDLFYIAGSDSQPSHHKATIISVVNESVYSENTKISLRVLMQAVGSQFGGFSQIKPSFRPSVSEIVLEDGKFRPNYLNFTYKSASLVVGNNVLWNEGNIKSLLNTQSVADYASPNNTERSSSAVDGGFGTFGSQSATLISGGRVGLFTGLPLSQTGISFASITGGHTSGQYIEVDPTYSNYEKKSYRVFETFLDHGVFPFVSLPSGSGSDNVGTLGHLSSDSTKKSNYKGAVFGGTAGLRVSGDIQLYVKNARPFGTDRYTAFIVHSDNAPATTTDYLIGNSRVTESINEYWKDWEPSTTGSIGYFSQNGRNSQQRGAGAHMPAGVGLFGYNNTFGGVNGANASVRRTATVSLGLTIADLKGISASLGQNLVDQMEDQGKLNPFIGENNDRSASKTGETLFEIGQSSVSDFNTMTLPALRGSYLYLESKGLDQSDGYYKIIDVPVISPIDASSQESKFGSENTLHGYISDYNSKVRNSLSAIVANVTVRVESNRYLSEIPNESNNSRITRVDQITPPQNKIRDTYDNLTNSYKWRILHHAGNAAGTNFQQVYVFDVENSGGSPTSSSSDLQGIEISPRALGKQSLPAELIPLATSDSPSDTPTELTTPNNLSPLSYDPKNFTMRLLGVHRNMDMRGKTSSVAFVCLEDEASYDFFQGDAGGEEIRTQTPISDLVEVVGNTPARLVVYSSERSDRLDESYAITTKRRFESGESGFVSLGYPERMGLGIVLDGGLGVVSGNAVRVHPQKGSTDSLGALLLYSFPYADPRDDVRDGDAVSLPSRFNRTEFYGDVVVAGYNSDIVIEDSRSAEGSFARINENEASASTVRNQQSLTISYASLSNQMRVTHQNKNDFLTDGSFSEYIDFFLDSEIGNYFRKLDLGNGNFYNYIESNLFRNIPAPPLPNDTLFPWTNVGVRVKSSGGLVYERAFRPQDATGSDVVVSHSKGAKSDRGIKGLEIPAFGECLLLPKGPPTLGGRVLENSEGAKIRIGNTPTDLPLYEFYNGPTRLNYGGTHAISIGNVLQEHGVYGRPGFPTTENEKQLLFAPKGNNSQSDPIEYDPGILSQAYHHSRSNGSDEWGGRKEILTPKSNKLYGYLALLKFSGGSFNFTNAPSGRPYYFDQYFSLFYVYRGKVVYIELDLIEDAFQPLPIERRTGDKPEYQYVNTGNNTQSSVIGRDVYGSHTSDVSRTIEPNFSFYVPDGIQHVFVEVKGRNDNPLSANQNTGWNIYSAHGLLLSTKSSVTLTLPPENTSNALVSGANALDYWEYISPHNHNLGSLATSVEHKFLDYSGRAWFYAPNGSISNFEEILHSINWTANNFAPVLSGKAALKYSYVRILGSYTQLNDLCYGTNTGITPFADNNEVFDRVFEVPDSDVNSEVYEEGSERVNSNLQVRLLDGMVLEDVTTGTFYTVGEIGRYRGWHSHMKPTSQVGDYVHYEHGMHLLDQTQHTPEMEEIYGSPLIRNANFGSIISSNGHSSPEILTDLSSHFNYERSMYGYLNEDSYPTTQRKNGFGDIVDNGYVRRPLLGHKFRVVPNVEFVPVLGYRSVRGGLCVPYDPSTSYQGYIKNADAVLFDANYSFLKTDIGKKIYICGTYEYGYVGWWVVTDVISNYVINPTMTGSSETFEVAVVRKIKRSGEYLSNPDVEDDKILPMRPQSPILEMTVDANSNGKNILSGNNQYNIDSHLGDSFITDSSYNSHARSIYFGEYSGVRYDSEHHTNIWMALQYLDDDKNLKWMGWCLDSSSLSLFNDLSKGLGVFGLVTALRANPVYNGRVLGKYFHDIGLSAWADNYDVQFLKWEPKTSYYDGYSKYTIPTNITTAETGSRVNCGVSCTIDTSVLTKDQIETVLGRGTFLNVDLLFNNQGYFGDDFSSVNFPDLETIDTFGAQFEQNFILYKGLYYRRGVNTNVCVSHLDKNSYFPNVLTAPTSKYVVRNSTSADFATDIYTLNDGSRSSDSATGGIRWVFSSPLLEENVGSYLHLTKQRPYRFGTPTFSQKNALNSHRNRQTGATESTLVNPFGWTSGYQNEADILNGEQLDLSTDIFRINRCPTTGDILVGGDCESYAVEDILCRSRKGFTKKGLEISYSPLSVGGNWPDSVTQNLPDTGSLNYPIMYALQPIARERIVTINPSSANSSIVLARGQHGTAPMVIPANPLAIETDGALSLTGVGSFSNPSGDFSLSNHDGEYYVSDPSTTGISVSLSTNGLNVDEYGKDYHWGEKILMDVSRPWLLLGRENAMQTHDQYFISPTVAESTEGNPQDLPVNVFGEYNNSADLYKIEQGNAEDGSQELYTINSYFPSSAIYTWCPAGEWWQIQTPLYSYAQSDIDGYAKRKTPISPTTPPPTLRIDLTEAFTQSVSAGSGLNTPYAGKAPRGSRLNRIWVNFGLDGDASPLPGSPFNKDHEEYIENTGGTNLNDTVLGNTEVKKTIKTLSDGVGELSESMFRSLNKKATNRSITFNLVVELPGSVASSQEDFEFGYTSQLDVGVRYNQDWKDFIGEDYEFSSIGGSNGSTFGGRLPTGAYSHSNNSEDKRVKHDDYSNHIPTNQSQYFGGTIVVPLYINREAGDMMPNIMERFVNVGPARFKDVNSSSPIPFSLNQNKHLYHSDWSIGDWYRGLGTTPMDTNAYLYDKNVHYTQFSDSEFLYPFGGQGTRLEMEINSITPVVWGSQNFYSSSNEDFYTPRTQGDILESNTKTNKGITNSSYMTFSDIRSAGVLASSMPRSSRMGGGVTSSFTSGLIPDTRLFDPFASFVPSPLAIHAPATTGITIAHGGASSLNSSSNRIDNYSTNGVDGITPANTKTSSSHNSFTVALTPVGDSFKAPTGYINMPSITGGENRFAGYFYKDFANVDHWDFGRYGRTLETNTGTEPKDRRFKVGNWLDNILRAYGIPAQSGSMLPPGARVFLEATVPWSHKNTDTNNGTWISSVKCSFEVETADGTAWTQDVNTMGED